MSLLLAALLQVGPLVTPGAAPALPHQTALPEERAPTSPAKPVQTCPRDSVEAAEDWLAASQGAERANAGECLGVAHSLLGAWEEAAAAFAAARLAADTPQWRARLGAMAGEAALNGGDAQAALAALDAARADAAGDSVMLGGIATFRARALVALKREGEADAALALARSLTPQSPQAWLLSATLSRRLGKLAEAQAQIERAYDLLPIDPSIGLEAGLIAMLSGRETAARRSWESVLTVAPQSDEAAAARGYLAQLDPPAGAGR